MRLTHNKNTANNKRPFVWLSAGVEICAIHSSVIVSLLTTWCQLVSPFFFKNMTSSARGETNWNVSKCFQKCSNWVLCYFTAMIRWHLWPLLSFGYPFIKQPAITPTSHTPNTVYRCFIFYSYLLLPFWQATVYRCKRKSNINQK